VKFSRKDAFPIRKSDKKLVELILYLATRCLNVDFGLTKLNKVLFYSDFSAFLKHGNSISGQTYFALQYGPAPKHILPVRKAMEHRGDIDIYEVPVINNYKQQRIVPKRLYDLSIFTTDEMVIVDEMLERVVWKTAKEASDESHKFIGWLNAGLEDDIPYNRAYLDADHILGTEPIAISKTAIEYGRTLTGVALALKAKYA
jgi:hypothetical protein